jgi:hypothetical protein
VGEPLKRTVRRSSLDLRNSHEQTLSYHPVDAKTKTHIIDHSGMGARYRFICIVLRCEYPRTPRRLRRIRHELGISVDDVCNFQIAVLGADSDDNRRDSHVTSTKESI